MNSSRLEMLLQMLEDDTTDSFVRYALAKEYEYCGSDDMAIEHFNILMRNDPDYVGLYYHLGKLYEKKEQNTLATDIYKQGISVSKKIKDFHSLSELNTALVNLELDI